MAKLDKILKTLRLSGYELEESEYKIFRNVSNVEEGSPKFYIVNMKDKIGICKFKESDIITEADGLPFMYPDYIMAQAHRFILTHEWNNTVCITITLEEFQRIIKRTYRISSNTVRKEGKPKKKRNRERPMCEFLRKKLGMEDANDEELGRFNKRYFN